MPHHYTKNTLECTVWCKPCGRPTQHRVDGGRQGPCLEHVAKTDKDGLSKKQKKARVEREKERQNPTLF